MPKRNELPADPWMLEALPDRHRGRSTSEPETFSAALAPWIDSDDPDDLELREILVAAYEQLTEYEKFVCDAVIFERLSFAQAAERIGRTKSQAFRVKSGAMKKLAEALKDHPKIKERLHDG